MRKRILITIALCLALLLSGCAKLVSTEYETVEVTIIDKYHRDMYITYLKAGNTNITQIHPAEYYIGVEYDNVRYVISGSDTYNQYKDKVGEKTTGTLEIRTYDNDTVRYAIKELAVIEEGGVRMQEKEIHIKVTSEGTKEYTEEVKKIKESMEELTAIVEQLNKSLKEFAELREKLF